MKKILLTSSLVAGLTGCASFTTKQTDQSYDETTGKPVREITTKATARTFFAAKSDLAKFRASQSDKTQSATVGTLSQSADASTNLTEVIKAVAEGVVKGITAKP